MSEKTGFFRRVFSFGQPEETAPERPADATPMRETTAVAADGRDAEVSPPTVEPGALAPTHPQLGPEILIEEPRSSDERSDDEILADDDAPVAADIPAPVVADEPAWLDPDAPEPEADFSWLEDGSADVSPSSLEEDSEPGVDAPAEDVQSEPESIVEPDSAHPSMTDAFMETPATAGTASEGDFSFLDPDAPLPEEEEEADFSWLEPEAPLPDAADETPGAASTASGAGGVALAAGAASGTAALPRSGDEGWRLREAASADTAPVPRTTWFERLREGLSRSSNQLSGSITSLFTKRRLDEATLQEFEDVLLQADLGVETALRITDRLSEGRFGKEITGDQVRQVLADEVEATLSPVALPLELDLEKKPHVILVVGVNGTGKTTTIGKLAAKLTRGGLKVTLCAGDTFRAAAVEQLKIWGERTGSEVIAKQIGADAAGLAFEAYDAAVENGSDVLIIDTAGRLQNKAELMAELEKIVRVLQKREPDAPHTVLQTLDATTGQNALSQVEIFRNVAGVNGLVMTKLDGTARGGILVAIAAKYRLPVYFIGVGEGIDDLEPFKARDFAMAIAGKA